MNYVYLSLGTNLFDRFKNLKLAISKLNELSTILEKSRIYETEPFGYEFQNTFLNICLLVMTNLKPIELLNETKRIENLMGRKKLFENSPRVIDIDILIFNDFQIEAENLIIPHKSLYFRKFFVLPLIEIFSKGYRSFNFDISKINFRDGWITYVTKSL
ncbi:MAG: 2-amino-4-hydroxy-6-hydroxymethyldihydropteridine diphosphokinase [candidate division WOR-3 bacterium]